MFLNIMYMNLPIHSFRYTFELLLSLEFGKKPKAGCKAKVSLTAPFASTVAEEIVLLLRKLHMLPAWNLFINKYINQRLCKVVSMVTDEAGPQVKNPVNSQFY